MKKPRFFKYFNFKPHIVPVTKNPVLFPCGMSRSGTTLLATILDSHTNISLCYELIPPPGLHLAPIINLLNEVASSTNDLKTVSENLQQSESDSKGTELFISHCLRAGIKASELKIVLTDLISTGLIEIKTLRDRLFLAYKISEIKRFKGKSPISGFKLNIPSVESAFSFFPKGIFIFILRDPRDVVASHIKRNFKRSTQDICSAWMNYLTCFEKFRSKKPGKTYIVKYEDLVTNPNDSIKSIFEKIPLDMEQNLFDFYKSQASIHQGGHPNIKELQKNFFTTSIGRWEKDLSKDTINVVEKLCGEKMNEYGYEITSNNNLKFIPSYRINGKLRKENIARIKARKFLYPSDYEKILSPYVDSFESLRLTDFIREKDIGDRKILLIRHDVDHDHLTALKIAKWEASRGIRTTYCLLHTAWYYGKIDGDTIIHSNELIECARTIQDLGHEINLHNNLVATALKEGINPVKFLSDELDFFRSIGISIAGTSTHGDKLCRALNFRNWELFTECCDDRFGGPRIVEHEKNSIRLGEISMEDFGLEYEAYDIARDIYYTDSGGRPRTRKNLPGRRPFGRKNPEKGIIAGILTHPIYWNFS